MTCILLSEHWIVQFLIFEAAGDCLNLRNVFGIRELHMNYERLRS